jgi:hypothetical protein
MHPTVRLWQNLYLNIKVRNPGIRPGPYWVSPRAVSWVWGCRPPSLIVLSSILASSAPGALYTRRLPCQVIPPFLHPSPPIFKPFFLLYFLHEAKRAKQRKGYAAAGLPLPPLPLTLSPPPLVALVSLPPIPSWPTLPRFSSPLSPTPSFHPSLHAAPPLLSPRFFVSGVISPRLLFPCTIWTLMPPLLMTSAQVFFTEVLVICSWWEFFPRPRVFVIPPQQTNQ